MKKRRFSKMDILGLFTVILALGVVPFFITDGKVTLPVTRATLLWTFNATVMEGCSCPMFCQCYFNTASAILHDGDKFSRYCRFNNVFNMTEGIYGKVDLKGVKFWVAGDLGTEFSDGQVDWSILTYDPTVTEPQREAVKVISVKLFPVVWDSFEIAEDASIS